MKTAAILSACLLVSCASPPPDQRALEGAKELIQYQCGLLEDPDRMEFRWALNRVLYPNILIVRCANGMPPMNAALEYR